MERIFSSISSSGNVEQKEGVPRPSIRLEFFRHSKQGPQTEGMQEYQRRLTDEGRQTATESGKDRGPNPDMAIIYGSPRDRSQETAYRQLFANQEKITPASTLEDIEEAISNKLLVGKKKIIDERLNFDWSGSQKFNEEIEDHFLKIKDTLRFLVEESDGLALENKDKVSTSYTRAAANVAEIVKKYLGILPNWEKIVLSDGQRPESESNGYAKNKNELQRFLGSHGATVENFLLKLIDKTEGREAALDFIKNLSDQNNFQFNDGYSVRLYPDNGQPQIEVRYHDKIWRIKPEFLDELINDRDIMNDKLEKKD